MLALEGGGCSEYPNTQNTLISMTALEGDLPSEREYVSQAILQECLVGPQEQGDMCVQR